MSTKPNFLIVGAAKSGTSSLFEYLRHHPDIYMPSCKEVSYFAGRNEKNAMSLDEYLAYFSSSKHQKRIGEASGAYLYSKDAPKIIADTLGHDIKIVIILRNPVDMSYALWGQNVRDGNENLSFLKAIEQEKRRMNDSFFIKTAKIWPYQYAYIDRATYAPQVKRYIDMFGKENVKVYIFERFFDNIEKSLINLYDFLDIDNTYKLTEYKRYNVASKVRFQSLHRFYSEEHVLTNLIRKIIPAPARRGAIRWLYKINSKSANRDPLDRKTKEKLTNYFHDSICDLEALLNISIGETWR